MRPPGTTPSTDAQQRGTLSEALDRVLLGAASVEDLLAKLLGLQCQLTAATAGVLLRVEAEKASEPLVTFNGAGGAPPGWLPTAQTFAPRAVATRRALVAALGPAPGTFPSSNLLIQPLYGRDGVAWVTAVAIDAASAAGVAQAQERLELTARLPWAFEHFQSSRDRGVRLERLAGAIEILGAVDAQPHFRGSALALCNEVAARFGADRAALGFLAGHDVTMQAMSQAVTFDREVALVRDLEAVMEECLDQDVELIVPAGAEALYSHRAVEELMARHGPRAVATIPLRLRGTPVAALTLERSVDRPFLADEIETLRLVADLCASRLAERRLADRWIGARAVPALRRGLAVAVGSRHVGAKLAVATLLGAIAFPTLVKGPYRVEAPFVFQAIERQIVAAPFDAKLERSTIQPGDRVVKGATVIALLNTEDLTLELAAAQAKLLGDLKEADVARGTAKPAQEQIALHNAQRAAAQVKLLSHRIGQARVVAPVTGVVLSGDLRKRLGSPVTRGEALAEVAPLDALRAEIFVAEDQITDVKPGQRGVLYAFAEPTRGVRFEVERIDPVAEMREQENSFRVLVRLLDVPRVLPAASGVLPGVQGVAKIDIGVEPYAWIWSRRLVNFLRIKLWL